MISTADCLEPLTLLVVEDDDGDFKAITRAFRHSRVTRSVVRARDGVEALERLRAEGADAIPAPHLLLVDINMPRMSGHELLRELRADPALRRTVAFVLSTSNAEEDRGTAHDLHAAGYILKERAGEDFRRLVSLVDDFGEIVELPR